MHRRARSRRRLGAICAVLLATVAIAAGVTLLVTAGGPGRGSHHAAAPAAKGRQPSATERPATSNSRTATATRVPPDQSISLPRVLGQMIVASFAGPTPSASLLGRIRAGQVGGVILFGDNVAGGLAATRSLTSELQSAARNGGNPPLLIMTDQEGGEVNRLAGPPTLAPSEMTTPGVALNQGRATGRMLRSVGVNVDLAPVADVERVAGSFLGTRSFGSTPSVVADDACAFAHGLASEQVAYTLKHFPGLGRATGNTDLGPVSIDAPAGALRRDYAAYRTCGANPMALVMISSASYPTLTGPLPAVMSTGTYQHELPTAIPGASPTTISDDLQTPAITSHPAPARTAINAGLDLLMYAQTEQGSADAYTRLLSEARQGLITVARIRAATNAIAALKRLVAGQAR
jgi:beta-N-acetylhexosaminidase